MDPMIPMVYVDSSMENMDPPQVYSDHMEQPDFHRSDTSMGPWSIHTVHQQNMVHEFNMVHHETHMEHYAAQMVQNEAVHRNSPMVQQTPQLQRFDSLPMASDQQPSGDPYEPQLSQSWNDLSTESHFDGNRGLLELLIASPCPVLAHYEEGEPLEEFVGHQVYGAPLELESYDHGHLGQQGLDHQDFGHQGLGHQSLSHQYLDHQNLGHKDFGHQDLDHQYLGQQDLGHQVLGHQDSGHQGLGHRSLGQQDLGQQDLGHHVLGHLTHQAQQARAPTHDHVHQNPPTRTHGYQPEDSIEQELRMEQNRNLKLRREEAKLDEEYEAQNQEWEKLKNHEVELKANLKNEQDKKKKLDANIRVLKTKLMVYAEGPSAPRNAPRSAPRPAGGAPIYSELSPKSSDPFEVLGPSEEQKLAAFKAVLGEWMKWEHKDEHVDGVDLTEFLFNPFGTKRVPQIVRKPISNYNLFRIHFLKTQLDSQEKKDPIKAWYEVTKVGGALGWQERVNLINEWQKYQEEMKWIRTVSMENMKREKKKQN